jgi:hypothetical protein
MWMGNIFRKSNKVIPLCTVNPYTGAKTLCTITLCTMTWCIVTLGITTHRAMTPGRMILRAMTLSIITLKISYKGVTMKISTTTKVLKC